jgi:polyhydroxybutyrate depolymerase
MTHDNLARTYRLNVPAGYNPLTAAPLVIMHHGGGQTADEIAAMHPALAYHANTNGMILVLPQSTHNERSTSWYNFDPDTDEPYVDDVGFMTALIDRLDAELNIDRSRVYAAGFSAGGIMCHYLAARTTNVFAAIAAVGSSIAYDRRNSGIITTNPPPSGPMPALIVNATNDCLRPYFGGYNNASNYIAPAIDAAYHYTNANVCSSAPTVTTNNFVSVDIFRFENCDTKPDPSSPQPNQVIRMHWPSCAPGTEVIFVTLTDGGHLWPDASDNVGFDANYAVIEFFNRH